MSRLKIIIFFGIVSILINTGYAFSQDTLDHIASNIDEYRGRTVSMELKLKYHDPVFNVLTFYDSNNTDITFDIKELQDDQEFKKQMLNLYRGRSYTVTFEVQKKGNLGYVLGKLIELEPSFLKKIPEEEVEIK